MARGRRPLIAVLAMALTPIAVLASIYPPDLERYSTRLSGNDAIGTFVQKHVTSANTTVVLRLIASEG